MLRGVDEKSARAFDIEGVPCSARVLYAYLRSKRDFSLHKPTDSSEGIGKAKASACSARNDRRFFGSPNGSIGGSRGGWTGECNVASPRKRFRAITRGYSGMEKSKTRPEAEPPERLPPCAPAIVLP
jgi:hypothetical protein